MTIEVEIKEVQTHVTQVLIIEAMITEVEITEVQIHVTQVLIKEGMIIEGSDDKKC